MFNNATSDETSESSDSNVMTDGGLPEYLTEQVTSDELEEFRSRVKVVTMGDVIERVDSDKVRRSRAENVKVRNSAMQEIEWTERLEANIINIEAWLHDHWLETVQIPSDISLSENRTFITDFETATVQLELDITEVIKASRKRATEDATHFLYVLGNWTYLAEEHDHVDDRGTQKLRRAFERAKQNSPNPPGDATCEEYGGGRRE